MDGLHGTRPKTGEQRAADYLNLTMACLIGACALGFLGWSLTVEFRAVRAIYEALSADDRRHLHRFGQMVLLFAFATTWAVQAISAWRRRKKA